MEQKSGASTPQVKTRAYQIWEREGRPEGAALEHWLRAEAELADEAPRRRTARMAGGAKAKAASSKKVGGTRTGAASSRKVSGTKKGESSSKKARGTKTRAASSKKASGTKTRAASSKKASGTKTEAASSKKAAREPAVGRRRTRRPIGNHSSP